MNTKRTAAEPFELIRHGKHRALAAREALGSLLVLVAVDALKLLLAGDRLDLTSVRSLRLR